MTAPLPPIVSPATARSTDPTYQPSTVHTGGNVLSISYLRAWQTCRRYFYWQYVYRWATGEAGIEPRYPMRRATPLSRYAQQLGAAFHYGLEQWRRSGWQTGQYDRDAAMTAARANLTKRHSEFESDDDYATVLAELEDLTLRYCAKWANEYPDVQVYVLPDGKPAIEEYFAVSLADSGYILNVRPDLLVLAHGYLAAQESKTASPQRASRAIAEVEQSAQGVAETWVLRTAVNRDIAGVYVDVSVKGNTRTVEKFKRTLVTFDDKIVDAFPGLVLDTLAEIGEVTAIEPHGLEEAFALYPTTGMFTNACSNCAMAGLCWNPGREAATLGGFRARTKALADNVTTEESSE